ncbi:MAG: DUF4276 family protein [Pseudanabaena sp. M046S1SP1A06QC]|nr:DUF4276 family protein [Pseudanabaena sp. M046S1SP1A06QC]
MQGRIIFLLEEPSMKNLLTGLLPRLFPDWIEGEHFLCIPHQGKSDLDKSIPRKLKAWQIPDDRFVIVRDNDNADCMSLKSRLLDICAANGRSDTLVRLVCQELQGWYLGDLSALASAFNNPKLNTPKNVKRFSVPDELQKPSIEIARLIPEFQKGSSARLKGEHLNIKNINKSKSFQVFITGLQKMASDMGWQCNNNIGKNKQ